LKQPVVIKLGGSAITDKARFKCVNTALLENIAQELAEAKVSVPILIIHGGGSFGHPIAKQYALQNGFTSPDQLDGIVKTRIAMKQLNLLIIDALSAMGLPVVSVSPSSCVITQNGRIQSFFTEPVEKLLQLGAIPVLFGDVALDSEIGISILSGDQIIVSLAKSLNASHIVVGLMVDGLFREDPECDPNAEIIEHITLSDIERGLKSAKEAQTPDVTGGMRKKVEELIPALEANIPVAMINLNEPKRLVEAIQGEKPYGTYLYP
jgi:isopentenyl phosphate kinase